jgi:hypothetical protein
MDDTAGGLTGGSLREEAAKGAALNPAQVVIGRILRASRSLATRSSKPSTSKIP